jgi:hypothetical protein
MRVVVSPAIQADHEAVGGLVTAAFEGIEASGVEVRIDRAQPRKPAYVGRAYPQLPSRPRTGPGTRYLVRLALPSVLRNRGYPVTYRYRGLSTAPWITVHDWRERVVALAAHEAFHIHQFREGLRRSEVQAERWALRVLTEWRAAAVAMTEARVAEAGFRTEQLTLFGAA